MVHIVRRGPAFSMWSTFQAMVRVSGFSFGFQAVVFTRSSVLSTAVLVALLHGATAAEERAELAWCSGDCGPVWLL